MNYVESVESVESVDAFAYIRILHRKPPFQSIQFKALLPRIASDVSRGRRAHPFESV